MAIRLINVLNNRKYSYRRIQRIHVREYNIKTSNLKIYILHMES